MEVLVELKVPLSVVVIAELNDMQVSVDLFGNLLFPELCLTNEWLWIIDRVVFFALFKKFVEICVLIQNRLFENLVRVAYLSWARWFFYGIIDTPLIFLYLHYCWPSLER